MTAWVKVSPGNRTRLNSEAVRAKALQIIIITMIIIILLIILLVIMIIIILLLYYYIITKRIQVNTGNIMRKLSSEKHFIY